MTEYDYTFLGFTIFMIIIFVSMRHYEIKFKNLQGYSFKEISIKLRNDFYKVFRPIFIGVVILSPFILMVSLEKGAKFLLVLLFVGVTIALSFALIKIYSFNEFPLDYTRPIIIIVLYVVFSVIYVVKLFSKYIEL